MLVVKRCLHFYTENGPVTYEFDYDPPEPTAEALDALVPHTCSTCEWANMRDTHYCTCKDLKPGTQCDGWEISFEAYDNATVEYYKRLSENGKRQ